MKTRTSEAKVNSDILTFPCLRCLQPPAVRLTIETDAPTLAFQVSHTGPATAKLTLEYHVGDSLVGRLSTAVESRDADGGPAQSAFVSDWQAG